MPTLDDINRFTQSEAIDFFLSCCGSARWAESMAACRPYWNLHVVFNAADVLWEYLGIEDRREALRNRKTAVAADLPAEILEDLELYSTRFGYGFLIAPPLPPRDEFHAALRDRLENSPRAEFDTAANHERAIMRAELRERLRA